MGRLIFLAAILLGAPAMHAADCPPLLDAALPTLTDDRPAWNFHKYLVDRRGEKAQSFATQVEPFNQKLVAAIEALLAEKGERK
jgi:glutathione peroxidase